MPRPRPAWCRSPSWPLPTRTADLQGWSRPQQIAFWINAYNVFTLRAIVDHYPIEGSWFSRSPRNSIRQIDGVWTALRWKAAGRDLTLDDIEHWILRPIYREPLVHFAVNCASVGCPPLAVEPYRAEVLDAQLDAATRRYLASPQGLVVRGDVLSVSAAGGVSTTAEGEVPMRPSARGGLRHPARPGRQVDWNPASTASPVARTSRFTKQK